MVKKCSVNSRYLIFFYFLCVRNYFPLIKLNFMRNFTLLFSLFFCVAGATAQVSKNKTPKKGMPAPVRKAMMANRAAKADAQVLWKPASEEHFRFMDGDWFSDGSISYTYDKAGNILTETLDFEGEFNRTTYTYNENNKKTSKLVESKEEEEDWMFNTKTTYTYDAVLPDFMTVKTEYIWDDVEAEWVHSNRAQSQTRTVTRDAKGNIISVELKAFFTFTGEWDIVQRTDITYDEATGKAISFDYRQVTLDTENKLVYGDPIRYKNIVWENTDGQIVADKLLECVLGTNRIKSADVYDVEGEEETLYSHIEVTYVDGKDDYVMTQTSVDDMEKIVEEYTVTDENGSVFFTSSYYMEGECMETNYQAIDYDKYGNVILDEEGVLTPDNEREIYGGGRYLYTYDEEKGVPVEVVTEMYEIDEIEDSDESETTEGDEEMTGSYKAFDKIVYSDYYNVLTAIRQITDETPDAVSAIYSLQGVAVGRTTKNLPAGVYIMKQGNQVRKVLKK